jgi:hypothetical protein
LNKRITKKVNYDGAIRRVQATTHNKKFFST